MRLSPIASARGSICFHVGSNFTPRLSLKTANVKHCSFFPWDLRVVCFSQKIHSVGNLPGSLDAEGFRGERVNLVFSTVDVSFLKRSKFLVKF